VELVTLARRNMQVSDSKERMMARLKAKVEQRKLAASVKVSEPGCKRHAYVRVSNFEFVPSMVMVRKGGSVTWTCCSQDSLLGPQVETHRIRFKDESLPTSKDLHSSESFTVRFDHVGRFEYHCANYPFVHGLVDVVEEEAKSNENEGTKTLKDITQEEIDRIAAEIENDKSQGTNPRRKRKARNRKKKKSQSDCEPAEEAADRPCDTTEGSTDLDENSEKTSNDIYPALPKLDDFKDIEDSTSTSESIARSSDYEEEHGDDLAVDFEVERNGLPKEILGQDVDISYNNNDESEWVDIIPRRRSKKKDRTTEEKQQDKEKPPAPQEGTFNRHEISHMLKQAFFMS